MYFTHIKLRNFGPFAEAMFRFEPYAVNWFSGNNGSGKTQLVGAILAVIVGKPALTIANGGDGPSVVELTMSDGESLESVSLMVSERAMGRPEVSTTTSALSLQILAAMSDPAGQRLLLNDLGDAPIESIDLREMENLLPESITGDVLWKDLSRLGVFERRSESSGQRSIVALIKQLAIRLRAGYKLPLIVDEVAYRWPENLLPFIGRVLEEIAKISQVIVTTPHIFRFADVSVQMIPGARAGISLAGFNPMYSTRRPNLRRTPSSNWIRGARYPDQESRVCEFKEVKGGNPLGAIKGVVDQYAVAFMNAGNPQEGVIFWGIRDNDRVIVGVQLRPQECDELRRLVTERLHQIVPPIAPTAYRIELHPVHDRNTLINDLYIVEVRIPSVRRTLLFATGGQEVYVKTDAGKRKLSPLELQQELVRRLGVDPEF